MIEAIKHRFPALAVWAEDKKLPRWSDLDGEVQGLVYGLGVLGGILLVAGLFFWKYVQLDRLSRQFEEKLHVELAELVRQEALPDRPAAEWKEVVVAELLTPQRQLQAGDARMVEEHFCKESAFTNEPKYPLSCAVLQFSNDPLVYGPLDRQIDIELTRQKNDRERQLIRDRLDQVVQQRSAGQSK